MPASKRTDGLRQPESVSVLELFPEERSALLNLLAGLTPEEWERPTACAGWSVKDVALHVLGGDLANVSRRRDNFEDRNTTAGNGENIVSLVNRINHQWVEATRRLSSRVICDLLAFSGPQLFDYFSSLDLSTLSGDVSWAGLDPAPVWLDVAREYTERWLHQQHIRDAVGKPGLADRHFMGPVLAAFVYALPVAFRDAEAALDTVVHMHIEGDAGGDWALVKEFSGWKLYEGSPVAPDARASIDEGTAWRLFTKGMTREAAEKVVAVEGDSQLGRLVLQAVSIIA
jgi:uncharacterized protein (TIGR03083 family)